MDTDIGDLVIDTSTGGDAYGGMGRNRAVMLAFLVVLVLVVVWYVVQMVRKKRVFSRQDAYKLLGLGVLGGALAMICAATGRKAA